MSISRRFGKRHAVQQIVGISDGLDSRYLSFRAAIWSIKEFAWLRGIPDPGLTTGDIAIVSDSWSKNVRFFVLMTLHVQKIIGPFDNSSKAPRFVQGNLQPSPAGSFTKALCALWPPQGLPNNRG